METVNPKPRIVIAGQMPPPYGGQTINIKRLFEAFRYSCAYQVDHWKFEFSRDWNEVRTFRLSKLVEWLWVILRLIVLRAKGPIDLLVYPSGGPHRVSVYRDILLLPFALLAAKRVVIHFQAAGIARAAHGLPFLTWRLLSTAHMSCWGAVTLTDFGREDPLSLGMSNVIVIPNGVEDHNTNNPPWRKSRDRVILHAGHLCPDKGTPALLEAFSNLAAKRNDVRLRPVGECIAPYSSELLERDIERFGVQEKVSWPGLLIDSDLQEEYRRASLVVFSSVAPYESFGVVLIEAMMWGLPLVVSDWRANVEVAGRALGGITYEPGTDQVAALSVSLSEALERETEWPVWSKRNRERYETLFTIGRFVANFQSLFANALVKGDLSLARSVTRKSKA